MRTSRTSPQLGFVYRIKRSETTGGWQRLGAALCARTLLPLLLLTLPAALQAQFNYRTNNGTITITGGCPNGPWGTVNIPDTINGLPVTSIGEGAFAGCTSLTSVTIPNSVTNIGNWAFSGCGSLTSVTIPNSVTTIGVEVFYGCTSLASITIGNGVTSIGRGAFSGCTNLTPTSLDAISTSYNSLGTVWFDYGTNNGAITITGYTGPGGKVSVPDTINGLPLTGIGEEAFEDCDWLTSITIPNSVTGIERWAFQDCNSLTNVNIGNSVASIGSWAFLGCTSLIAIKVEPLNAFYSSVDGVLFNKDQTTLIQYPRGKAGSYYAIPNRVTSIQADWLGTGMGQFYGAFYGCTNLTTVTLPDSMTNIGAGAFSGCTSLTSATIPNSVTSIGQNAFSGCTSLSNVTIPNSVTTML